MPYDAAYQNRMRTQQQYQAQARLQTQAHQVSWDNSVRLITLHKDLAEMRKRAPQGAFVSSSSHENILVFPPVVSRTANTLSMLASSLFSPGISWINSQYASYRERVQFHMKYEVLTYVLSQQAAEELGPCFTTGQKVIIWGSRSGGQSLVNPTPVHINWEEKEAVLQIPTSAFDYGLAVRQIRAFNCTIEELQDPTSVIPKKNMESFLALFPKPKGVSSRGTVSLSQYSECTFLKDRECKEKLLFLPVEVRDKKFSMICVDFLKARIVYYTPVDMSIKAGGDLQKLILNIHQLYFPKTRLRVVTSMNNASNKEALKYAEKHSARFLILFFHAVITQDKNWLGGTSYLEQSIMNKSNLIALEASRCVQNSSN